MQQLKQLWEAQLPLFATGTLLFIMAKHKSANVHLHGALGSDKYMLQLYKHV